MSYIANIQVSRDTTIHEKTCYSKTCEHYRSVLQCKTIPFSKLIFFILVQIREISQKDFTLNWYTTCIVHKFLAHALNAHEKPGLMLASAVYQQQRSNFESFIYMVIIGCILAWPPPPVLLPANTTNVRKMTRLAKC